MHSAVGKAKLVFTPIKLDAGNGIPETVKCYNHFWESKSREKAPLMDCFASAPGNTHEKTIGTSIKVRQMY